MDLGETVQILHLIGTLGRISACANAKEMRCREEK